MMAISAPWSEGSKISSDANDQESTSTWADHRSPQAPSREVGHPKEPHRNWPPSRSAWKINYDGTRHNRTTSRPVWQNCCNWPPTKELPGRPGSSDVRVVLLGWPVSPESTRSYRQSARCGSWSLATSTLSSLPFGTSRWTTTMDPSMDSTSHGHWHDEAASRCECTVVSRSLQWIGFGEMTQSFLDVQVQVPCSAIRGMVSIMRIDISLGETKWIKRINLLSG
jgi:hypothetical protein